MSVDLTREYDRMTKEIHRRIDVVGEYVMWYEFLEVGSGSVMDDVYDEGVSGAGGLSFKTGVRIPTIYHEEIEDESRAQEDGRQPVQNVRLVFRKKDMDAAGLTNVSDYQPRLNDMFIYDDRLYRVYRFSDRGRMGERTSVNEVLVTVDGVEIYEDQDYPFSPTPTFTATESSWPNTFP